MRNEKLIVFNGIEVLHLKTTWIRLSMHTFVLLKLFGSITLFSSNRKHLLHCIVKYNSIDLLLLLELLSSINNVIQIQQWSFSFWYILNEWMSNRQWFSYNQHLMKGIPNLLAHPIWNSKLVYHRRRISYEAIHNQFALSQVLRKQWVILK